MQQGTGGDNLAVRWQLPDYTFEEPVPAISGRGTRLIPCTGVDSQPGIYQQTTNATVVERQDLSMSVLVTNQSAVTYQWRLNGTNLPGPNASKSFYAITNASVAVNDVRVYNNDLTADQIKAIGSLPDPVILGQPQSRTAYIGLTAQLRATVSGTAPMTNQWQFNGTNLVDGSYGGAIISGATSNVLTISYLTANVQGT